MLTLFPLNSKTEFEMKENLAVSTAVDDQHFPMVISDGKDGVIITWRDARNGNYDIYAQRINDQGETVWQPDGIPVCKHPASQTIPEIVSDTNGGAFIVWRDSRNGNQDSYAQRIDSNGRMMWNPDGVEVCTDKTLQDDITLIPDGDDGFIAVWEDWRTGNQDIYAQKINAEGKSIWDENGVPVLTIEGDQYDPVIISDDAGGVIVVWWDIGSPDWNIYAQRLDRDGKQVWDLPIPVCSAKGNQGGSIIVSDGKGGAFCIWPDYRDDPNFFTSARLYAQHFTSDGTIQWKKDGILICKSDFNQQQPSAVSDGNGGFIVIWRDERDVFADLYIQRFRPDGKPVWDLEGLPVCVEGGVQQIPILVPDGNSGAIATWLDYRNDFGNVTEDAIYTQKVTSNGEMVWETNGRAVCVADKEQITPSAISTGDGGIVVVWSDARGDDYDIYLQRVD
ncbi:hypothetical protein JT359_18935 [Candidatus Poribacteria bacterium]|nr:hypothetical protein [Candidatus Poribacteria bacterium]